MTHDVASAITDLDAWVTSVLFPVTVIVVAGLLGWIAKCLTGIYGAFRRMETKVDGLEQKLDSLAKSAQAGIDAAQDEGERANDRIDRLFPHAG